MKLFPWMFFAFFVFFWLFITVLMSRVSGWSALNQRYSFRALESGRDFPFSTGIFEVTGGFGLPIAYKGILFVRITEAGLALSVWFPFRLLHPPLVIPWSAIGSSEKKREGGSPLVAIRTSDPNVQITFGGKLAEAVWECVGGGKPTSH